MMNGTKQQLELFRKQDKEAKAALKEFNRKYKQGISGQGTYDAVKDYFASSYQAV